jgi:hypothetical protein
MRVRNFGEGKKERKEKKEKKEEKEERTHLTPRRHSSKDSSAVVKVVVLLDVLTKLEADVLDVRELVLDEFPLLCGRLVGAVEGAVEDLSRWREASVYV